MDIAKDLQQRLARVRQGMAEQGLGGLIVYYGAQHNMLRMDQVAYLTDFKTVGPAILLVPKDGPLTLVVTPEWDAARARETMPAALGSVTGVAPEALARTAAALAAKLDKPL